MADIVLEASVACCSAVTAFLFRPLRANQIDSIVIHQTIRRVRAKTITKRTARRIPRKILHPLTS